MRWDGMEAFKKKKKEVLLKALRCEFINVSVWIKFLVEE